MTGALTRMLLGVTGGDGAARRGGAGGGRDDVSFVTWDERHSIVTRRGVGISARHSGDAGAGFPTQAQAGRWDTHLKLS